MGEKVFIRDDIITEGPEGLTLLANKCKSCGKVYFPKLKFCANCSNGDLEEFPLNRRGTLYTYTTTYMPSTHFQPPFANGYIEIPGGTLVFAPLEILEDKPFQIGMEMELKVGVLWEEGEKEFIGFKFCPV